MKKFVMIFLLIVIAPMYFSRAADTPAGMWSPNALSSFKTPPVMSELLQGQDEIGTLAQSFRELIVYIKGIADAAQALSRGDLTIRVESHSDQDVLSQTSQILVATMQGLLAETGQLVHWAKEGQLDKRGDPTRFRGTFRDLVQGMNETLNAVISPINEASAVLERLAARDLTAPMRGEYRGDYARIAQALNTAQLIHKALQNAEEGVVLNHEVLRNLAEINTHVDKVSGVIGEISVASDEQQRGVDCLQAAVGQLNWVTQQTAAHSEETASSAQELASQAATMQHLVSTFRLRQSPPTPAPSHACVTPAVASRTTTFAGSCTSRDAPKACSTVARQ